MRIVLFFDLPSVSNTDKREYRKFIKTLKRNGFIALQESVYSKLALNQTIVDLTIERLKKELPKEGSILTLTMTEKQFAGMKILLGDITTDVVVDDKRVIKL